MSHETTAGTSRDGRSRYAAGFEAIEGLLTHRKGSEVTIRTDEGPIDGRIGTIDERERGRLVFVRPTDTAQVRRYATVTSLEAVTLAVRAERNDGDRWFVSATLVGRTATGAQWQVALGQVRDVETVERAESGGR